MLIATNGRGRVVKCPSKPTMDTMFAELRRGDHMILERQDEERDGDWYVQVLFRDDDTYQLEYRDGVPAEHYQTMTASREKACQALQDWAAGKPDWQEGFVWNNLGAMFAAPIVKATDLPAT
ncbi:hypothetical protein [Streptomyces hyaluromycini]|uniref:hypothetical protein n=1 Tax=Streptomyces hyaluromycini TaxID=1377993 RepID=UPI001238068E|nr:hypothetical protein [Streptomyces hyaluromycini]